MKMRKLLACTSGHHQINIIEDNICKSCADGERFVGVKVGHGLLRYLAKPGNYQWP
jgi:hypothetical protein